MQEDDPQDSYPISHYRITPSSSAMDTRPDKLRALLAKPTIPVLEPGTPKFALYQLEQCKAVAAPLFARIPRQEEFLPVICNVQNIIHLCGDLRELLMETCRNPENFRPIGKKSPLQEKAEPLLRRMDDMGHAFNNVADMPVNQAPPDLPAEFKHMSNVCFTTAGYFCRMIEAQKSAVRMRLVRDEDEPRAL